MKQLLNAIIFMCIGGFIGAGVQMAINYDVTPPERTISAQQQFLNEQGHPCIVDGTLTVKGDGETEGAWNDYIRDRRE